MKNWKLLCVVVSIFILLPIIIVVAETLSTGDVNGDVNDEVRNIPATSSVKWPRISPPGNYS